MTPSTPQPCLGQAVKLTLGRRYRFSGWVKAPGAGPAKGKSGVSSSFLPEKMNRHRIMPEETGR